MQLYTYVINCIYIMTATDFFKCLSDDSRLCLALLIQSTGEACVCDLMAALEIDQPKTSRHLSDLRRCGVLESQRRGKWVYYQLHPKLPLWAHDVLKTTLEANYGVHQGALSKLRSLQGNDATC